MAGRYFIRNLVNDVGVCVNILHDSIVDGHGGMFLFKDGTYLKEVCHGVGMCR